MARNHTHPRYWKSRQGYYVCLDGTQILLARGPKNDPETKALAHQKFYELLASRPSLDRAPREKVYLVQDLLALYLEEHVTPATPTSTRQIRERYLLPFRASFGNLPVSAVTRPAVKDWASQHATWSEATAWLCLKTVLTAFNWGLKHHLIKAHNLKGLYRGLQVRSRSESSGTALMTDEIHQQLLLAALPHLRPVLHFLHDTGARPHEVLRLTAAMYNPALHAFVPHKKKVKSKHRTVYLTDALEQALLPLMARHPDGLLFRNTRGNRITEHKLSCWFITARERLNFPPVTAYMYRHKYACDFLLNGGRIAVLAQLLGTSIKMIEKHYSHIGDFHDNLLEEVRRFRK